jgi:hypothetical protein
MYILKLRVKSKTGHGHRNQWKPETADNSRRIFFAKSLFRVEIVNAFTPSINVAYGVFNAFYQTEVWDIARCIRIGNALLLSAVIHLVARSDTSAPVS